MRQASMQFTANVKAPRQNREASFQKTLVHIIRLSATPGLVWGASMNGVKLGKRAAVRMKEQGMEAGEADLWFLINGQYYAMELKNGKAGRQSPEQKDFESRAIESGGIYVLVRDIEEAQKYLRLWGAIRNRALAMAA